MKLSAASAWSKAIELGRARHVDLDGMTALWSGAILGWASLDQDGSPARYIHRCFSCEKWEQSDARARAEILGAHVLHPLMILLLTGFCTWRYGGSIKARTGKGRVRQAWEQLAVARASHFLPPWYYIFELHDDERRRRAGEYLNRFETKSFVYRFLRQYAEPAPTDLPQGTAELLSNKALFVAWCEQHRVAAVPFVATADKGAIVFKGGGSELPSIDLFLKPLRGTGGRGAARWDYIGGGSYRDTQRHVLDGPALIEHVKKLSLAEACGLRPRVVNHPEIADLSNGALCTARVMTCLDEHHVPEATTAVFRMAQGSNTVVDNFHSGGIVARVDILNGELGRGSSGAEFGSGTEWLERHPDTEGRILGRKLPHWEEAIELVRRAHRDAFADQVVIGWDVALLKDGPQLVEGNKGPDVDLLQRGYGEPLGNSRLGALLAFNLQRAVEKKQALAGGRVSGSGR